MATNRHRIITVALSAGLLGGSLGTAHAAAVSPFTSATAKSSSAVAASLTSSAATRAITRRHAVVPPVVTLPSAPATPAPAAPAPTVSPSGASVPRGDLAGWKQVYAEDFGTTNATGTFPSAGYQKHWDVYADGWKDTSHNGTYMPSKVLSVHNGVLDYFIHSENGQHQVAAPWLTDTKGTTYGRYSIRFRADALPGYKTAWLLWPDSESWPNDGEVDFPEGNLDAGSTINAFAHYASSKGGQDAFPTSTSYAGWHTVTVEWVPGKITFVLDDKVIGTSTKMVPSDAMHWVLQTETNLDGYAPSDSVKGHVLVDWVTFYTRG